jgi:hypothetical protein
MGQHIEAPTEQDIDRIAHQLIHASDLAQAVAATPLSGGELTDLVLLQRVLDSKAVEPEATYSLQALGMAFGKVFVNNNEHYDWWMVEDEYGRDPAVRYKETSLLMFPQTVISKRIEDRDVVDVQDLYEGLQRDLESIREEYYADD